MSESRVVSQLHEAINEIAFQHERVTQYYQRVEALIAAGVEDFPGLESVLEGLVQYTLSSFELEESLMKLVGYQQLADHRRSHEMFLRRLGSYRDRVQQGKYAAKELVSLLKIWMSGHIEDQDLHFVDVLQRVASSAG